MAADPTSTAQAFKAFDTNLNLDPAERTEAQDLHNDITDLLKRNNIAVAGFLQGSFARKTMLRPLHDVDKVVILYEDLTGIGPEEMMDKLESVIAEEYPSATFERSRHALKITLPDHDFHFDTVPAWETAGETDDILIANRDSGGWDVSNTRELIRTVSDHNQSTGGRFIHQVRMAKHAISRIAGHDIPGLHVESWAFEAITDQIDAEAAVAATLGMAAHRLGGPYYEPTGVDRISDRLRPAGLAHKTAIEGAASRAAEARALTDAGDDNEAIRIWHDLLGEEFPEPQSATAGDSLRNAFLGGSITSSGGVAQSKAGRQHSQPTRSWRSG
jgi:hypothetical protein